MTEEEAKTKWCPHATVSGTSHVVVSFGATNGTNRCLGSECMAWRWEKPKSKKKSKLTGTCRPDITEALLAGRFIDAIKRRRESTGEGLREAKEFCEKLRNELMPPMQPAISRGYCGLTGAP